MLLLAMFAPWAVWKVKVNKERKERSKKMSEATLTSLLEYLYGTLTPSNMRWIGERLIQFADNEENQKPFTMEEIEAMLDASQADIAAGRTYSHEEVMREWDQEIAQLEREELEYAWVVWEQRGPRMQKSKGDILMVTLSASSHFGIPAANRKNKLNKLTLEKT